MSAGIAILGTGLAAAIHTKTLRAVASGVPRFYASRDESRAAAAAARYSGAGSFGGYEQALNSPSLDTVLIALPPVHHREWTLRALAAGKHVIVEKPPFMRAADVDVVEAASVRANRQVLVAENYYYKPIAKLLREIVSGREVGDIRFIHVNALKHQPTANWRDQPALSGGGALFEGGIHWISLLANIGLTPHRVRAAFPGAPAGAGAGQAAADTAWAAPPGDRNAVVTIEYAEGAVATLFYSWDLRGVVNGVRFSQMYGTGGSVYFETNGIIACATGRRPRLTMRGLTDLAGYRGMMMDFLQSIRANVPPAYDLGRARRDLRLIEEAYASAAVTP